MPAAEIITIGNELLNGTLTDSNSVMICRMLTEAGIQVSQKISVGDDIEKITKTILKTDKNIQLKIFSGGLGPTHDDKTKEAVCKSFHSKLVLNVEVLRNIESLFADRKMPVTQINRDQALVPDNAMVLMNMVGTAPGLVMEKDSVLSIFLPAVPFELEHLMKTRVIPLLQNRFPELQPIVHSDFLFSGIGESYLYTLLSSETNLFDKPDSLAFLPSPGLIRFRQILNYQDRESADEIFRSTEQQIMKVAPDQYVGRGVNSIAEVLQMICVENKLTFSVAESCTGGNISHLITSVSGASSWFNGGIIAYSNNVKREILGVEQNLLDQYGAVSEQVVIQMALGVKRILHTECSVAVSGIAGPTGGSADKPVGTVWIASVLNDCVKAELFHFGNTERHVLISRASNVALMMILRQIRREIVDVR